MDHKRMAQELIEKSGGLRNIKAVGHCATRLRFTLFDKEQADMEGIKKVEGVLGPSMPRDSSRSFWEKN